MKFIMTLALITASMGAALACSPPRYPFITQTANFEFVLASQKVKDEMIKQDRSFIESISNGAEGIVITMSNGCSITAKILFKPLQSPGLCPERSDVEVLSSCF